MSFYVSNGNVYTKLENGEVHPVGLTAKNKVVQTTELESVKVTVLPQRLQLQPDAVGATVDDLVRKFHLSEDHPIKFSKLRHNSAMGDAGDASYDVSEPAEIDLESAPRRRGRPARVKKD